MTMPFDDEPYSKWSITYWTASVVFFWKDWWGSRRGGMWYFIGVCAAVGVLLVLFFIVPKAMHESTRRAYERRWIQAQNQEKWTEADLWLRRLLAMGDKRPVVRYQHALVVEKLGRTALAEAKMRELAAERDFPAALAWLAARSLDANATPEKIQNAIQHLEAAVQLNGDDEKLRVGLADAYTRAGRLKDAANQLLSVAKKRPQYNLHLARLYAEMGDAAGAKERAALAEKYFVDKSLENPENPDLVEPVADAMMLQGKWEEALRYVSRRITDESRSRNLRSRIHTVASDALMKDPATQIEAVRHLYRALEAAPINRVALLKLARLAPQIIQISPRDAEPIRHWLTQAYESTPDDLELTALLGLLHMQPGGDLQQAETCLAKAAEKEPILLLDLAQVQERLQKPDASTATLQLAVEKLRAKTEPNEATYFALSEALSRLGNFPEAEKLLVEATEKFPSPLLRTGLSQIYYREAETQKQEDLSARIGYLISAVRVSQGHPPSEAKLAEIALASPEGKAGVTDAANELVTTGKAIRGGHMVLGVVAAKENRWNDAVFHFEQAVSQAGDDAALLNNLAWALAKRNAPGDAKRSLELAEMAVQRAPQNPDIRETRGLAWLVNRQWNRAISDLEFALASFPDRKHLHLLLADAYRGAGNISMAEKHAQLAQ